jgi:hypothetical protein
MIQIDKFKERVADLTRTIFSKNGRETNQAPESFPDVFKLIVLTGTFAESPYIFSELNLMRLSQLKAMVMLEIKHCMQLCLLHGPWADTIISSYVIPIENAFSKVKELASSPPTHLRTCNLHEATEVDVTKNIRSLLKTKAVDLLHKQRIEYWLDLLDVVFIEYINRIPSQPTEQE